MVVAAAAIADTEEKPREREAIREKMWRVEVNESWPGNEGFYRLRVLCVLPYMPSELMYIYG